MKKIIICILFLLIFSCSDIFSPGENINTSSNPVITAFDPRIDNNIKERWAEFLTLYNAEPDTEKTRFIKSTSYLTYAKFNNNLPVVITDPAVLLNQTELIDEILEFYEKWQDLFGCSVENLELYNIFRYSDTGSFYMRFIQKRLNKIDCVFVLIQSIEFYISSSGQLTRIISSLIPDVEIDIPDNAFLSRMINNTIGHTFEINAPLWSSFPYPEKHTFSINDSFELKDGFELFVDYEENYFLTYYLKGIVFSWVERGFTIKCTIYYHPETGEIIHIKIL
ncbi:hypothetical protein ACFL4T_00155 [candidate division KSB1 bacterium]